MFARGSQAPVAGLVEDVWHNAGSFLLREVESGCDHGGALSISSTAPVATGTAGGAVVEVCWVATVPIAETCCASRHHPTSSDEQQWCLRAQLPQH